jgi:hypothetical protein
MSVSRTMKGWREELVHFVHHGGDMLPRKFTVKKIPENNDIQMRKTIVIYQIRMLCMINIYFFIL